jgi:hypothetical protein
MRVFTEVDCGPCCKKVQVVEYSAPLRSLQSTPLRPSQHHGSSGHRPFVESSFYTSAPHSAAPGPRVSFPSICCARPLPDVPVLLRPMLWPLACRSTPPTIDLLRSSTSACHCCRRRHEVSCCLLPAP